MCFKLIKVIVLLRSESNWAKAFARASIYDFLLWLRILIEFIDPSSCKILSEISLKRISEFALALNGLRPLQLTRHNTF